MSRHRDVRNMDYSDDYHGYDDVYGHSVDDDYYVSPSDAQYIYNRESSREQNQYVHVEHDIKEDDDGEFEQAINELSPEDNAKLQNSVSKITDILGSTNISEKDIKKSLLQFDFNIERTVNMLLERTEPEDKLERKEKDLGPTHSVQIKIRMLKLDDTALNHTLGSCKRQLVVPKLNFAAQSGNNKFNVPKLNFGPNSNDSPTVGGMFNTPKPNFVTTQCSQSPVKIVTFSVPKRPPTTNDPNNSYVKNGTFSIPKLNFNNSVHSKPMNGKISEPCDELDGKRVLSDLMTEQEYSSLSELIENHLKLTNIDTITNSTKQFKVTKSNIKRNGFKHSVSLQEVIKTTVNSVNGLTHSSSASALLDHVKKKQRDVDIQEQTSYNCMDSAYSVVDEPLSSWNIDLSAALKSPHSSRSLPRQNLEEHFDIPFTDCDPKQQGGEANRLPCTLDASGILLVKQRYMKAASPFAKLLCRSYKKKLKGVSSLLSKVETKTKIPRFSFNTSSPDDQISKHLRR